MIKLLMHTIIIFNLFLSSGFFLAMDNRHEQIEFINFMKFFPELKIRKACRGNDFTFVCISRQKSKQNKIDFLKKMIKKDAEVINGVKQQYVIDNVYSRNLFMQLVLSLSQQEKDELFEYGLEKASYNMLFLLTILGARVDVPWSHYKEPYSQYIPKIKEKKSSIETKTIVINLISQ